MSPTTSTDPPDSRARPGNRVKPKSVTETSDEYHDFIMYGGAGLFDDYRSDDHAHVARSSHGEEDFTMRSCLCLLTTLLVLDVAPVSVHAQSSGSPDQKHCTIGEVSAALQAYPISVFYAGTFPADIKVAGLGGDFNCQFRFFFPVKPTNAERWTYCEEDVFLGGAVWLAPYKNLGVSRDYAIDELEKSESAVRFGPIGSALSERSLVRTGYKEFVHPINGKTVFTQEAFITQEEPGTYVSDWTAFYMGSPVSHVVVEIDVVSHEEHLDRVEEGTWRTW